MRVNQVLLAAVCLAVCSLLAADVSAAIAPIVDYSDTFTVGVGARTDGYYTGDPDAAHEIEYAAPSLSEIPTPHWLDPGAFSFNSPATVYGGINPYPGSAGNPGSTTGFIQTGGLNWSIAYGLRTDYYVQGDFNWANTAGAIEGKVGTMAISSFVTAGDWAYNATGGLSVLFRRESVGAISLFNGETETATEFTTGIAEANLDWHNFGVRFNQDAAQLSIYVDEVLKGTLDLATFADGIYETYSNAAVGLGNIPVNPAVATCITWCDNFQVGGSSAIVIRPGDANYNGKVDEADAAILAENWLTTGNATWRMGDFNDDGNVDDIDATIMATNWTGSGSASQSAPEPSTLALLFAGFMVLIIRRRCK